MSAQSVHGVRIKKSKGKVYLHRMGDFNRPLGRPIELDPSLRKHEREARIRVQKSLFDLSINLGPALLKSPGKDDPQVERMARLLAEESNIFDSFDGVYKAFQLLRPPVDPKSLVHISHRSPIMQPLVGTMVVNVEGFGQSYTPTVDLSDEETQEDLKAHFQGRLVQELESDAIIRLRTSKSQKVKLKKADSNANDMDKLIEELMVEAVPVIEHRPPEDNQELERFETLIKSASKRFAEKNFERLEKIRERTFSRRLKALEQQRRDERLFLKNFFDNCNPRFSWMQIRKRKREDLERIGGWAMEVYRNPSTNRPVMLGHIPFVDVRMTTLGPRRLAPVTRRINSIEVVEEMRVTQFRKYAQAVGRGVYIWFKDFGDNRIMDRFTGAFVGENRWDSASRSYERVFFDFDGKELSEEEYKARNKDFREANELLYYGLYNAMGSPYPIPRWFGCLTLVQGMLAMEEVNAGWFDNNLIPPIMVLVTDTNLNKKSHERIEGFFENRRGRENNESVMVIESDVKSTALQFSNTGKPTIKIERLRDQIETDATHTKYDEMGRLKLRACWRLPPAHLGQESQYTRQSVNASNTFAEKQVFRPEREDGDDVYNKHLMPLLSSLWLLKTNGPPVADNLEMAQVLSILGKAGFLPVGEARPEVEAILNRPLSKMEGDELDNTPFPLILIQTKAQTRPNKGPQDDTDENPQNKMGARPDKDGFTTDSEVVKTFHKVVNIPISKVHRLPFEEADDTLFGLVEERGGAFVMEEDGEVFFTAKMPDGTLQNFYRTKPETKAS